MAKKVIEISGVKVEVDMRQGTLKSVDSFKVGDNVKLLKKEYENYKSLPAVIVGFDEFPTRPTIVVAYLESTYSNHDIKFAYINSETKDHELCPMNAMEVVINKTLVLEALDRSIDAKEREVVELKAKRNYFLEMFGRYFEGGESKSRAVSSGIDA
jgi:hypothetical protein